MCPSNISFFIEDIFFNLPLIASTTTRVKEFLREEYLKNHKAIFLNSMYLLKLCEMS